MSKKLKIYACSGIGDANKSARMYDYWLDNTSTVSNTQAVNALLSYINEKNVELLYLQSLSDKQIIENLNAIDFYSVCLYYAQKYSGDSEKLIQIGNVLGSLYNDGVFSFASMDNTERDENLNVIFTKVEEVLDSNRTASDKFLKWWRKTIIDGDKVGLSEEEQTTITETLAKNTVSGIGYEDYNENADLAKYLNDASNYFLYTYFTEAQLSALPRVFRTKKKQQVKIYNHCKLLYVGKNGDGVYGSEEDMKRVIRTGIMARYKESPEDVCANIVAGVKKTDGVGLDPVVIAAIISAAVTITVTLISVLCSLVAQKYGDKYASIDQMAIDGGCPNKNDFDGLTPNPDKVKNWLPILAIGAAVLLLLKNN